MADDFSDVSYPNYRREKENVFRVEPSERIFNDELDYRLRMGKLIISKQHSNMRYLEEHPEIQAIIRILFREHILNPSQNSQEIIGNFCNREKYELQTMINLQLLNTTVDGKCSAENHFNSALSRSLNTSQISFRTPFPVYKRSFTSFWYDSQTTTGSNKSKIFEVNSSKLLKSVIYPKDLINPN